MRLFFTFLLFMPLLMPKTFFGQSNDKPINYYGTEETIKFDGIEYNLSWSSHPANNYYKQEYIAKSNNLDHFNDMLLIDFIISDASLETAVKAQVNKVIERKKTDAVCNYRVSHNENTDEYLLDFIMSDGKESVRLTEWNAYRYKVYTDKAGHKGVLLFGVSHRAYDEEALDFLKQLGKFRDEHLKELRGYDMPKIQIN